MAGGIIELGSPWARSVLVVLHRIILLDGPGLDMLFRPPLEKN